MKIKDVMRKKVLTIPKDYSFSQIVDFLIKNKITGAPVIDGKGNVVGVISEKDLFYKLFPTEKNFYKNIEYYMNYKNLELESRKVVKMKAKSLMSKDVVSVEPEDHILTACSLFLVHDVRRLPVLKDGRLVGIVTTNDIYRNFLKHLIRANK